MFQHNPDILAREAARKARKAEQANYPSNRQYRKDREVCKTIAKLKAEKNNLYVIGSNIVYGGAV